MALVGLPPEVSSQQILGPGASTMKAVATASEATVGQLDRISAQVAAVRAGAAATSDGNASRATIHAARGIGLWLAQARQAVRSMSLAANGSADAYATALGTITPLLQVQEVKQRMASAQAAASASPIPSARVAAQAAAAEAQAEYQAMWGRNDAAMSAYDAATATFRNVLPFKPFDRAGIDAILDAPESALGDAGRAIHPALGTAGDMATQGASQIAGGAADAMSQASQGASQIAGGAADAMSQGASQAASMGQAATQATSGISTPVAQAMQAYSAPVAQGIGVNGFGAPASMAHGMSPVSGGGLPIGGVPAAGGGAAASSPFGRTALTSAHPFTAGGMGSAGSGSGFGGSGAGGVGGVRVGGFPTAPGALGGGIPSTQMPGGSVVGAAPGGGAVPSAVGAGAAGAASGGARGGMMGGMVPPRRGQGSADSAVAVVAVERAHFEDPLADLERKRTQEAKFF